MNKQIVFPQGETMKKIDGIIQLNETAAFLWDNMQEDIAKETLIERLKNKYLIDVKTAEIAVNNFIDFLIQYDMLNI